MIKDYLNDIELLELKNATKDLLLKNLFVYIKEDVYESIDKKFVILFFHGYNVYYCNIYNKDNNNYVDVDFCDIENVKILQPYFRNSKINNLLNGI